MAAAKSKPKPNTFVLTDVDERIWLEAFELTPKKLGLPAKPAWSIRKTTLHGGLSHGVDIINVDNGALRFSILPTRGMGVWRGEYKGLFVGWRSPVRGPVNPAFVNVVQRGGLGWLAGFDETIVRCGLESNGAPCRDVVTNNMGQRSEVDLTLHGKIANVPASHVEVQVLDGKVPELVVSGRVCESGLFMPQLRLVTRISSAVGSNAFTITDQVTNMKATEAEMELLYHCNFGPPFLAAGSVLETPARFVAPRDLRAAEGIDEYSAYAGPTPGYVEQCYWYAPLADAKGRTLAMLRTQGADKAIVCRYNARQLPFFTQWKNTAAEEDGYATGLEPGTNYPNPKTYERSQGRVVKLKPGEVHTASITIEVCDSRAAVARAQKEIAELQALAPRTVHRTPQRGYSDV
jgi:galactose mutarotase-like enzyme